MWYILGLVIIGFIFFVYKKFKGTKGLIGQLVYNESFLLKPYSAVDMKLIRDIEQAGGKILVSELIVFKWFLINDIFHVFNNNNFLSQEIDGFYSQIDMVMTNGFTTELKKFGTEGIKQRIHKFYGDKIGQLFSLEQISQFNEQEIFNSIQFDELIYEDIASLITKGEIEGTLEYNPVIISILSNYVKQCIYAQRLMIKHLFLNPQLILK